MDIKIPDYESIKTIKFNAKHSEYPEAPILRAPLSKFNSVQGIIMEIKVQGIMDAIARKKSFDPLICYPETTDIFDGHHRYHAFLNYVFEEEAERFIIPYIEIWNPNETFVTEIKEANKSLTQLINDFKKDSPTTTETPGMYNPIHDKPENEDERNKDLQDCVSQKIPIIADENPEMDHDQVVAIAYSMCREEKKQKTN